MSKKLFLLLAFVLLNSTVIANDCVFFAKGNQLVPSEQEKDNSPIYT